jgi:SPP1 gp7 family putative phage head morphogenesis protein
MIPKIVNINGSIVSYVDEITDRQFKQYMYNLERKNDDAIAKRDLTREKLIRDAFDRSTQTLQNNLNGYYMRYADKEGISIAEARKRADAFDIRAYEERARIAVRDRDFSEETNEWLRLYNLKMRASREEVMLAEANLEMVKLYDDIEKLGYKGMTEEGLREARRQAGILNGQPIVKEQVEKIANATFYGNNFSQKIWGYGEHFDTLRKEVFNILTDLNVNLDGYRRSYQELADRMGVAESHAERLIKTEERRVISRTAVETYKKNEFDGYVYVAEAGACDVCGELGDKVFRVDDAREGVNLPVAHPNCRCSTYGYHIMERFNMETGEWEVESPV